MVPLGIVVIVGEVVVLGVVVVPGVDVVLVPVTVLLVVVPVAPFWAGVVADGAVPVEVWGVVPTTVPVPGVPTLELVFAVPLC